MTKTKNIGGNRMLYVEILLYVLAGVLLILGIVSLYQRKKRNKFGKLTTATIQSCRKTGIGPLRKYWATLIYKVGKRKYKVEVHTNFTQILNKGEQVPIGYNPENPEDICVRMNDVYKVFFVLSAVIVLLTNLIDTVF
ncbi:MAG: hypothetical protein RR071_06260 [Lachnospiraceae bacterium]